MDRNNCLVAKRDHYGDATEWDCARCAKLCRGDVKYREGADTPDWYLTVKGTATALSPILGIAAADLSQILGFWRKHFPQVDREDGMQLLAESLLTATPGTGALAWVIAKRRVADWWRNYKAHRGYDIPECEQGEDKHGDAKLLADIVVDRVDYLARVDDGSQLDTILSQMPDHIRTTALSKARGARVGGGAARELAEWGKAHSGMLAT